MRSDLVTLDPEYSKYHASFAQSRFKRLVEVVGKGFLAGKMAPQVYAVGH
jgi:hypothetical protein